MDWVVRTSEDNWFEKALRLYVERKEFGLMDDANLGLTEEDLKSALALIRAAKSKGRVPWRQIASVLTCMGITGVGVWIIAAAISDPEPTTKLGLLIAGGLIITFTGSIGTLMALGIRFSVGVRSPRGHEFVIKPERNV